MVKYNREQFWNTKRIDQTKANYRIAMGSRDAGKSYAVKKVILDRWFNSGMKDQCGVIRRLAEEIKLQNINTYWSDMLPYMLQLIQNDFPHIDFVDVITRTGKFEVIGYSENPNGGDPIKTKLGTLGYYFALAKSGQYKSNSYPDIRTLIFEEFISDKYGYENEFTDFINLHSTIVRRREGVVTYLLANTVNRNSPMLIGMNINARDLKKGDIKLYEYFDESNNKNTVAVEWHRAFTGGKKIESYYIFNNQKEMMIRNGEWQTDAYPLWPDGIMPSVPPDMSISLNINHARLYVYVFYDRNNDRYIGYCTKDKMLNRVDYLTLYEGMTWASNYSYNYRARESQPIVNMLKYLLNNNYMYYAAYTDGNDMEMIASKIM